MLLRSLPLLCLLFLPRVSLAAQAGLEDVPETCPVTKPSTPPCVPPQSYSTNAPQGSFWFGTDELWTFLPVNGTWRFGHPTGDSPIFREKLFFWQQGFDWHEEPQPKLKVTGKRLDASAPLVTLFVTAERANNAGWSAPQHPFMVTAINIPTPGGWQITAHHRGHALAFVIWLTR